MLRSSLIYLSKAEWPRQVVTHWGFARRAAARFISGEDLDQAIQAVRTLNHNGINATLDHLGEHTHSPVAAETATQAIIDIIDGIQRSGIRSNISIKLTQIGLRLEQDICITNLKRIVEYANRFGIFVRIDMEDSPWVDTTLSLYRRLYIDEGLRNCGVVIQSYLYRSETDIQQLVSDCSKVRLCKGAYKEPPEIAFPKKSDVDKNYDLLAIQLIEGAMTCGVPVVSEDGRTPPIAAIASHDPLRLAVVRNYIESKGYPKNIVEFQMLYGIRRELQEQMAAAGYPVRIYVPFGTEWYPYYVRRLAERPANVWFFVSNFFRN